MDWLISFEKKKTNYNTFSYKVIDNLHEIKIYCYLKDVSN